MSERSECLVRGLPVVAPRRSRRRAVSSVFAALTCVGLLLPAASPAQAKASANGSATPSPGAAGAGDPYFPAQGNGGYDVATYKLAIDYVPATQRLAGVAVITATTTQALSRFNLDLRPWMRVNAVLVDGAPAAYSQTADSQELVVTPAKALRNATSFTVLVRYAGTPQPVIDPDGSVDGWVATADGAYVASEPQGSPSWFPANDTPNDKATFDVTITVPAGLTAVSNGRLVGSMTLAGRTAWAWSLDKPISPYLVTATLGKFTLSTGKTPGGVPYVNAVDPTQAADAKPILAKLPAIVDFFAATYGSYPFNSSGAVIDDAPEVGYALETATRPVFDSVPDEATLAHELAHQWFGDDVTLTRWSDIWLGAGFSEFSAWLWEEHTGGQTAASHLDELLAQPADSEDFYPAPGNIGVAENLFAGSLYSRGAGTLQALREKLGDEVFFKIMRGWIRANAYDNASVPDFTAYAQKVSRQDLSHFFDVWLYDEGKPANW
jgi:aminopeptidase N